MKQTMTDGGSGGMVVGAWWFRHVVMVRFMQTVTDGGSGGSAIGLGRVWCVVMGRGRGA
ncbi:hypothetical protein [Chthonobacter rhizosphaerae]|uniref:hypothetical protein n=1 Tax=Chthonobacter rhizosphaerae TaxID=2735553 RepID=UPI0015EFBF36|nr:hypothetical protein [Chthonobacter rhizosphaerae]